MMGLALVTVLAVPASASALETPHSNGLNVGTTFQGEVPAWASSGAIVNVLQWPNLANATVGSSIPVPTVASTAVTGSNFSVSEPSDAFSNFEVIISNGQQDASVFVSNLASAASATNTTQTIGTSSNVVNVPAFGAPAAAMSEPPSGTAGQTSSQSAAESTSLNSSRIEPHTYSGGYINGCAVLSEWDLGTKYSVVGEAHTADNVTGSFTYGNNASSGFSVGASVSGQSGSFTSGGTYTYQSSFSETTPILAGSHVTVLAEFVYGEFDVDCSAVWMGDDIIPYLWTGGLKAGVANSGGTNPWGTCPPATSKILQPGNSASATWGGSDSSNTGISFLGFSFGVNQSWGTDTSMSWHASSSAATTYLCGPGQTEPGGEPIIYDSAP